MAITYNDNTTANINHNSNVINTVTYNGTVVFSTLVNYTFPNSNAKMTSNASLGICTYSYNNNGNTYLAYKAFDNNLATAFIGSYTSTATSGRLAITFPFPIYIQSITIKNESKALSGSGSISGLKTGTIYVTPTRLGGGNISSTAAINPDNYYPSGRGIIYASIDRSSVVGTASGSSTHTNESYKLKPVQAILIYGTAWQYASGASTSWHIIGDVSINFKVASNDLSSWKSTYNIS